MDVSYRSPAPRASRLYIPAVELLFTPILRAYRTLRYSPEDVQHLKATRVRGMSNDKARSRRLVAFADLSFAKDMQSRCLVSGEAILYAGGVVVWFGRT